MKRVSFLLTLIMAMTYANGQTKVVKEAKSAAESSKFGQARQLIKGALTNSETQNDPATWDVAGFIETKYSAKENEKVFLKQPYDTAGMYNSIYDMYHYFFTCDSLAQLPDAKGKIKNKYRKNNSSTLRMEYNTLINGGVYYYNDKGSPRDALKFFGLYLDAPKNQIFSGQPSLAVDSIQKQISFYATMAANRLEDYPAILKYAPQAFSDAEYGSTAMELYANAQVHLGDTVAWLNTLREGVEKFPQTAYFFGNLIDYYSSHNKGDEAMKFADDMLAKNPNNAFNLYVKAYLYHNNLNDLDHALEYYKKTIAIDPNYAEAYHGIGKILLQKVSDFDNKITTDLNNPQYAKDMKTRNEMLKEIIPYFEKVRQLRPEDRNLWYPALEQIYYLLNMGKELDELKASGN